MISCKARDSTTTTTVGAFARVDLDSAEDVRTRLAELPGVTLFDLDELAKVGLIIEAVNLESAYTKVTQEIKQVEGVLGVWPVYVDFENR